MEELPKLPGVDPVDYSPTVEPKDSKRTEASQEQFREKPPAVPPSILSYELDISPEKAPVTEVEPVMEINFDRRHEVMDDERSHMEPPTNGMVPLGQVLADHPSNPALQSTNPTTLAQPTAPSKGSVGLFFASSLYRKAVIAGLATGLVTLLVILFTSDI